jgi:hypothetical protein
MLIVFNSSKLESLEFVQYTQSIVDNDVTFRCESLIDREQCVIAHEKKVYLADWRV